MHWIDHIVRHTLVKWRYLAVIAGLLGEDVGLPVRDETVLMFASFLAHKHTGLRLIWVIVAGSSAAMMGDNLGFVGNRLGSRLIR